MNSVLLIVVSIAVVSAIFAALYVWFEVLGHRFHGATTDRPADSAAMTDGSTEGLLGERLRTIFAERV